MIYYRFKYSDAIYQQQRHGIIQDHQSSVFPVIISSDKNMRGNTKLGNYSLQQHFECNQLSQHPASYVQKIA